MRRTRLLYAREISRATHENFAGEEEKTRA